jgi:3-demethoxyubiquinol 3-hydroxylase
MSVAHSVSQREALTIARILKVNHAGEHGAIRIYRAQLSIARRLYPAIVPTLSQMLSHEIEHRQKFANAMTPRHARPCRIMSLWGLGGSLLGFATALMGTQTIWITTAAVEAAVHRHLDDQLYFLARRDVGLHQIINDIREEELSHLRTAEAEIKEISTFSRVIRATITVVTDGLIWLSTWGDSTKMKWDLAASKPRR